MNSEVRHYASGLRATGELMNEISNKLGNNNKEHVNEAIERFRHAQTALSVITPPNIVMEEHKQFVHALGEWFSAIKIVHKKNQGAYERASEIQKQKEIEISKITTEIGHKLTKSVEI